MKIRGILYLFIATFMFGSMEVAIKATNGVFNPIQLNFLRFVVGGIVLIPLAIKKLKETNYKLKKKDWLDFNLMGFVGIVVSLSFYIISLQFMSAHEVGILFSSNTFISIFLATVFLKEKVGKLGIIGLSLAFLGMIIVINPIRFEGSFIGVVLCLLAAFAFAIYGVFCKVLSDGKPTAGNVMTCFAFLTGSIQLLILIIISKIPQVADFLEINKLKVLANIPIFQGLSWDNFAIFLFISVGVTGIGFATYFLTIEKLSVAMASLTFFIKPVLSSLIAFVVLHEVVGIENIVGLIIISLGSAMLFINNLIILQKKNKVDVSK